MMKKVTALLLVMLMVFAMAAVSYTHLRAHET